MRRQQRANRIGKRFDPPTERGRQIRQVAAQPAIGPKTSPVPAPRVDDRDRTEGIIHIPAIIPLARSMEPRERIGERGPRRPEARSEEHTSELQSLMRISYAVFCLKKKKNHSTNQHTSLQL